MDAYACASQGRMFIEKTWVPQAVSTTAPASGSKRSFLSQTPPPIAQSPGGSVSDVA